MNRLLHDIIIYLNRSEMLVYRLRDIAVGKSTSKRKTEAVARIVNDYTDIVTAITEDIAEINTLEVTSNGKEK